MLSFVIYAAFLWCSPVGAVPYCPVSHCYDTNDLKHFHGYPVSFSPPEIEVPSLVYNCNVVNTKDPTLTPVQKCYSHHVSLCPVRKENIRSALSVAPWPQYIDAFKRFGKKGIINVFYLGGSMTAGSEAGNKCICSTDTDSRCPPITSFKSIMNYGVCAWPAHISRWLVRKYPTTIFIFHDYSSSGATSRTSHSFIDRVRKSKSNLSHPALFFLDFSVNDAFSGTFNGAETFMRIIIGHFGRHFNVKPTIVVLEQYPHAMVRTEPPPTGLNSPSDYAMAYRRISKHYGAVLISLREVFWTYFGEPEGRNLTNPNLAQRYYPISPFDPYIHTPTHPPWYIQLYMADVLAECMIRIAAQFDHDPTSTIPPTTTSTPYNNTINNLPMLYNNRTAPDLTYTPISFELPKPLYDISAEIAGVCDLTVPYVVDAVPSPLANSGPEDMTKGWVQTKQHNAPGWLIDDRSPVGNRTLTFPIIGGVAHLRGHIVKIKYLLSYEGMGTVNVSFCGEPLADPVTLDGLWPYMASVPHLSAVAVSGADIARCQVLPADRHSVDIVYLPGSDRETIRAKKHHHQFKVFDVRFCAPVTI